MKTWWQKCISALVLALAIAYVPSADASVRNLLEGETTPYSIRVLPKKDLVFFDALFRSSRIEIAKNSISTSEIELEDKIITSAVLIDLDRALVSGSKGSLYLIDLQKGKLLEELKISNKTQHLVKSPVKMILATEGLLTIEKIRQVETTGKLRIKDTLDVERAIGLESGISSGPEMLHFFDNGNMALLNRKGKVLGIDPTLNTKAIQVSPVSVKQSFRKNYDLIPSVGDTLLTVGDDLSITVLDANLNIRQIQSPIRSYLPQLNESLRKEIKIEEESTPTCRTEYANAIANSKKSQLYTRILTGAVVLINPVVGIGGVLFNESNLMFDWDSIDHAILSLKILNDAAKNLQSEEIKLLAEILNQFDAQKFASEKIVRNKLKQLNESKAACNATLATIKDLMIMMILE